MTTEPRYMQLMRWEGWNFKHTDTGKRMWIKSKDGKTIAIQGDKVWDKDCIDCHWGVGL